MISHAHRDALDGMEPVLDHLRNGASREPVRLPPRVDFAQGRSARQDADREGLAYWGGVLMLFAAVAVGVAAVLGFGL